MEAARRSEAKICAGSSRIVKSAVQNGHQPPRKTQDQGSAAAQLLGRVETTVGVREEEVRRGVSGLQRVRCHVCVAEPALEVVV